MKAPGARSVSCTPGDTTTYLRPDKYQLSRLDITGLRQRRPFPVYLRWRRQNLKCQVGVEAMVMTDETVVDVLEVAEKVLVEVSERVKVRPRGRD